MKKSGIIILIFFSFVLIIAVPNIFAGKAVLWNTDLNADSTVVDSSIVDSDFVKKPFDLDTLTINNLRKHYSKFIRINREPVQNVHVKNQTDTLLTVRIKNSEFIFYKIPGRELLESATIKDPLIKLSRRIAVGMTIDELKSRFSQLKQFPQIPPTLTVSGEEGEGYVVFTFDKKKLIKIEFFAYLD
jgi:hypothetical protein